jgi:putative tryptophan/tyrosine transport system substrate-binding protein
MNDWLRPVKRLGLGLFLIALASTVLLVADRARRRGGSRPHVAVFQYNSVESLELGVKGIVDSLREHGWESGRTMDLTFFNAESDISTANSIAREAISGKFTHVITVSTNCLQIVAKANRDGKVFHIFGVVADPLAARVGINPRNPFDHPRQMVGIGSLMPVGELLAMARRLNPRLRKVGIPWNPAETNSQVYTRAAREASGKLGIELLEGNVENSAAVGEVTDSLAARGAEVILMTGDVTVAMAADTLVASARRARIPVMCTLPTLARRGALFAIGADYYRIGRQTGDLAARVLSGESPARLPILYQIPKVFAIDRRVLPQFEDAWTFPPDVIKEAQQVE